jgi:hypothetical protein
MKQVKHIVQRASRGSLPVTPALERLLAFAIVIALSGLVSADSRGINFETSQGYLAGSIQDQPGVTPPPNGWGGSFPPGLINPLIDQLIEPTYPLRPATFGDQSWRISNFYTAETVIDMPFSPSLTNEAGETNAQNLTYSGGIRKNHFEMEWGFSSANPFDPETDNYLSVGPDRGDGARMSEIRLEDHLGGTEVWFRDYQDRTPRGQSGNPLYAMRGCGTEDGFTDIRIATVSRTGTDAHSVRLAIDFIDGPRNDIVKVYVDGTLRHTGTTWEDYYRWCPLAGGGTGTSADRSRTVDSILFRVGGAPGPNHPQNLGFGFLIDNITYSSSRTAQECEDHHADGDGDVKDGHGKHAHSRFHKECCDKRDGDHVEHDDDERGHHFKSTSVDWAEYKTTPDGRQVTMTGIGLDNGLPVAFTLIAVDHDGNIPATYSIVLTNGYAFVGEFVRGTLSIQ